MLHLPEYRFQFLEVDCRELEDPLEYLGARFLASVGIALKVVSAPADGGVGAFIWFFAEVQLPDTANQESFVRGEAYGSKLLGQIGGRIPLL